MNADFDIAIVGSGFSGSLLAMIAKRLGHSVVLLERERHPRFAIGESSTPIANLLLEQLAQRYNLPQLMPLTKWGTWQKAHPQIGCGLKRGFTFFHHRFGKAWASDALRRNELMVGASPRDAIADTHWYRPDFDHFLVRQAQALGVEYLEEVKLARAEVRSGGMALSGEHQQRPLTIRARTVFDASGPRGFLHRTLGLRDESFSLLPPTQGLFTHFHRVIRWDELHSTKLPPPYPVDDAAVHHVFEGGWIWVLRFNNGITSAGAAVNASLGQQLNLSDGAAAWDRLLQRLPGVREQFANAQPLFPFLSSTRLSFRSAIVAGESWALLPSAAGFIDPLLSTGFPLTLLGVKRLGEILERDWATPQFDRSLTGYATQTIHELETAERLVAALYANMNDFELFAAISLLYFAAASFTETAWRLGRMELAGGSFLLGDHASFDKRARLCLQRALQPLDASEKARLLREIHATVEPVDVAGLCDAARNNWFPARTEDLLAAAGKLGVASDEIRQLLVRSGFVEAAAV